MKMLPFDFGCLSQSAVETQAIIQGDVGASESV